MKTLHCFFVILATSLACRAQQFTAQTGIMSEYLGSIGATFYGDPILVSQFDVSYHDWYVGMWSATGLADTPYGQTYGDEWDVYAGWAHKMGPIKLDLSSSYYAISQLGEVDDDLWVAEVEISAPDCPYVQPYIRWRYFGEVGDDSPQAGQFWFGGIRKTIPLNTWNLHLQLSTAYAGGALRDVHGFVYGRFTASLDIPVTKRITLVPTVLYQIATPGSDDNPNGFAHGSKVVGGAKLKFNF